MEYGRHAADAGPVWFLLLLLHYACLMGSGLVRGAATHEIPDKKLLVCYYANWSVYRPGLAKFTPENIDPFLCTHLVYAFAGMNKNYELKPFDSYNDLQLGNYKKFTNLKSYNPELKLMIAVGGWNEGSKRFSALVASPAHRLRFVRGALSFLRRHGFDGLDLDWEYPGSRDGASDGDKRGYRELVEELRSAFDSEALTGGRSRLLLTMAVPAGKQYIDAGYDVPAICRQLDFLNLLTYDYHTSQEPEVRHHAPLGSEPGLEEWNPNAQLNAEWTVRYYVGLGCHPSKLVLGVPTYGRSFKLADPEETEPGAPAAGPGEKGEATREAGYLAYYEICGMIQDHEWELEAPRPEAEGPYAYKDDQWVGFDDEDIIAQKVQFIFREGLGGGMVWTLDNDDFRGKCYGVQSPLIRALKAALEGEDQPQTPATTTRTPATATTPGKEKKAGKSTTTVRFTTPDPGPAFACEDEGFFNHPTDCKKYFWCLDGGASGELVAHAFTCPSGLHFNKKRDACDYAANVVCREVRRTTTTTTTARPRPKPKTRPKTTPTTARPRPRPKARSTTTTTLAPKKDREATNNQSLAELLQLLQKLGMDRLHEGEDATPRSSTTEAGLFVQYAQPAREAPTGREGSQEAGPTRRGSQEGVKPRGPQFRGPLPEGEEVDSRKEEEEVEGTPPPSEESDFRFVYHAPSREKKKKSVETTTTEREDEEEEEEPTTSVAPPRRRVAPRTRPATTTSTTTAPVKRKRQQKQRVPAQTTRSSQVVLGQDALRGGSPSELMMLATGKPAIPAPTRRRRPTGVLGGDDDPGRAAARSGRPGLARLPDGRFTCLRRGVHPHPGDCGRFIVCVPGEEGEELDGFIHDCPGGARFVEEKGRCTVDEGGRPCAPPTSPAPHSEV